MPAQKAGPEPVKDHGPHAVLQVQIVQGLRQLGQQSRPSALRLAARLRMIVPADPATWMRTKASVIREGTERIIVLDQ